MKECKMRKYNVTVLMSTYNGEKYIREQIDSILNQEHVNIRLLIRDDGSRDNTIKILNEYSNKYKNIKVLKETDNLKPAKSFLKLLKISDDNDYFAFSDQDDYWEKNKLYEAIKKLENINNQNGKLYFSSLKVVDENLKVIFKTQIDEYIDFSSAILKNICTGCTMVFDKTLKDIINSLDFEYISMHDSMIYRIALLIGSDIIVDNNSYIKYRQHTNNVVGLKRHKILYLNDRIKELIHNEYDRVRIAIELKKSSIIIKDKKNVELINYLAEYKTKAKYKAILLFSNKCRTKSMLTNLAFKVKILLNRG